MSTHRKVIDQLHKSIHAHRNSHRDHLEAAGLGDQVEATISPLGPAGDMAADTGASDE